MNRPVVIVLMATHNGEKFLRRQIESILNSTLETKIIISDDNSSDSTQKIISDYSTDKVILISNEKKGSASKNFSYLIKNIPDKFLDENNYYAFSDQDDYVSKTHYENSINLMKKKSADLCGSSTINVDENSNIIGKTNYQLGSTPFFHFFESISPGFTFVLSNRLFRNFRSEMIKNPDQNFFWHDWLLCCFAIESGYKTIVKKYGDVFYRQHTDNVTGARSSLSGTAYRIKKIFDGFYSQEIINVAKAISKYTKKENHITDLLVGNVKIKDLLNVLLYSRRRTLDRFAAFISILIIYLNKKTYRNF